MKRRSIFAVLLLPFVTLGIYSLYWEVKNKGEMCRLGADIPTAWLLIVPFVSIWWLWKFSKGVEHVTQGRMSGGVAFLLLFLLGFIGQAIVQDAFNNVGVQSMSVGTPNMPGAPQPYPGTVAQVAQTPMAPQMSGYQQPPTAPAAPQQPGGYTQAAPMPNPQAPQPPQPPYPPNPPLVSG